MPAMKSNISSSRSQSQLISRQGDEGMEGSSRPALLPSGNSPEGKKASNMQDTAAVLVSGERQRRVLPKTTFDVERSSNTAKCNDISNSNSLDCAIHLAFPQLPWCGREKKSPKEDPPMSLRNWQSIANIIVGSPHLSQLYSQIQGQYDYGTHWTTTITLF